MPKRKVGRPRSDGLARFVRELAKKLDGERIGPSAVRLPSGLTLRCVYRSASEQTGAALVRMVETMEAAGKVPAVVLNDRFVVCSLEDWSVVSESVRRKRDHYFVEQHVEIRHETKSARYLEKWLRPKGRAKVAVAIRLRYRRVVAVAYEL